MENSTRHSSFRLPHAFGKFGELCAISRASSVMTCQQSTRSQEGSHSLRPDALCLTELLERFEIVVTQPPVMVPVELVEYAAQLRPILCVLPADEAIVISIKAHEFLGNIFLVQQEHRKKVVQAQHQGPEQDEPAPVLAIGIAESLASEGQGT